MILGHISGHQQLANGQKTVLSGNRKGSIKQTNTSQVLVSETVPDRRVQPSRRAKMTRFGDNPVTSTVSIPPRRQPGRDTSTRNRREFKLNVTDPDDRSEIITDVTIRMPDKAGTMMMEVKVDPGAQPSCIPLHKFKTLFPHLCRDGLPKEGLLDNTQNEFQSYNGGDMTCYGHILIDVKDKVTKKYHPIRFYVMNTDVPRILISHAASYWLGLVRVLCDNKAPRIKRQVTSIDKKSDFRAKSSHFRTSSPNTASSSQKKQMTPKTVTSGKGKHSKSKDAQFRGHQNTNKEEGHWSETWQRWWTSVMRSSTAKRNHLRQLERNQRHQNRVTRSIQDQIRILRIMQKMVLSVTKQQVIPTRKAVLK